MLKIIRKIPQINRFLFSGYKNPDSYDSILKEMDEEDQITRKDEYSEEQWEKFQTYQNDMKQYFNQIDDKEFLSRSKKLLQSHKMNQEFNPNKKETITDDYKNYSKYEQSFAKIKQRDLDVTQDGEKYRTNMLNFLNNLTDDLTERRNINMILENATDMAQLNSDTELLDKLQIDAEVDFDAKDMNMNSSDDEQIEESSKGKYMTHNSQIFHTYGHEGRLSPKAKENIYQSYMEGWTVRDLALRYGIIPERVKSVIWLKKQFYDEYLPRMDMEELKLALDREMMYNEWFSFVDYGIDLQDLHDRSYGQQQVHWYKESSKLNDVDTLEKLKTQKVPKIKNELIVEGYHGKGNNGYYLKNQINHTGLGSMRVSKKFKEIIKQGQKHYNLTEKVQKKLKYGPRIASQGYGFY